MERNKSLSIKYDIIGFGRMEDEERIKNSIKENRLEKEVCFHGRRNHSELRPFFERATIGVCFIPQTSFYDIQPSTKLFEYAMSGLITIATNTLANKKYITCANGVLCNDSVADF